MAANDIEAKKIEISNKFNFANFDDYKVFPKYFEIETVNACNARCKMCTVLTWNGSLKNIIADELWNKFVINIRSHTEWINNVSLTKRGETLLDPKISTRIKQLKNLGVKKVSITTNGSLMNKDIAINILKNGIDEVNFSIDGFSKKVYEGIRIGLNRDIVYKNTENFIKLRDGINPQTSIRIRLTMLDSNISEINTFIDYWEGLLNITSETERGSRKDEVYAMPLHTWGNQIGIENKEKILKMQNKACTYLFSSMSIDYDGRVVLCCVDTYGCKVLGNLAKNSIEDIWGGKIAEEARNMHLTNNRNSIKLCLGCDLWDRDKGFINKRRINGI